MSDPSYSPQVILYLPAVVAQSFALNSLPGGPLLFSFTQVVFQVQKITPKPSRIPCAVLGEDRQIDAETVKNWRKYARIILSQRQILLSVVRLRSDDPRLDVAASSLDTKFVGREGCVKTA